MKIKRGILCLFAVLLLCVLAACGGEEKKSEIVNPVVSYASSDAVNEAVGFVLTDLPLEGIEVTGYSVINGTLAQVDYTYQDTTVELRMSATERDFAEMAGIYGGKSAGGVQWGDAAFSNLDVGFLDETYYCEFSYQGRDGTLYYAISQTDTDFNGFTDVLQALVEQITEDNRPAEAS